MYHRFFFQTALSVGLVHFAFSCGSVKSHQESSVVQQKPKPTVPPKVTPAPQVQGTCTASVYKNNGKLANRKSDTAYDKSLCQASCVEAYANLCRQVLLSKQTVGPVVFTFRGSCLGQSRPRTPC